MNHVCHETVCRHRHTSRTYRASQDTSPQVRVTLSDDLLNHLRKMAQSKQVPLRWLVAGLVCDTFETGFERCVNHQVALAGR
jgi:hypothetical protein